jgi:alanine dehydrogenase
MNIGIPTEIKADERRVALTPAGTRELTRRGHRVVVERGAGAGSGFSDDAYAAAGAELGAVDAVFGAARRGRAVDAADSGARCIA